MSRFFSSCFAMAGFLCRAQSLFAEESIAQEASKSFYCNESLSVLGYDQGFFFEPRVHGLSLKLNGLMQSRFVFDRREGSPDDSPFKCSYDFENTRDALNFSGYLARQGFYNIRLEMGAYVSGIRIDWAYGGFFLRNGLSLTIGQMRIPSIREWSVTDEYQLTISRGYTTSILFDQDTAIQIGYEGDRWRVNSYVGNGLPGNVSTEGVPSFIDESPTRYEKNNNTWLVASRVEWIVSMDPLKTCVPGTGPDSSGRLSGVEWAIFNELTHRPNHPTGVLLGFFASYARLRMVNAEETRVSLQGNLWQVTFDAQALFNRGSLYTALWMIPGSIGKEKETIPFGALLEGGFYLLKRLELFGRGEYANWGNGSLVSLARDPDQNTAIATVGANLYLVGQNLKLSVDAAYSFFGLANVSSYPEISSTDWLTDAPHKRGQVLSRFQLQAFF